MEKMCKDSVVSGVKEKMENSEIKEEIKYQISPKNFSPVFGGVTSIKNARYIPSTEDDIPSYQIPRDYKRFSDISEEQDSVLPISPVCTPPSVKKFENFEEPLIHTIGTIVKKNGGSKVQPNEGTCNREMKIETKQYPSGFEELGMSDKDISWNSSMETPAPNPSSLTEYNTIERATLLPENDQKIIQPRALFSPYKNDDFDCVPLKYSSESDNDGEMENQLLETYKKLEDVKTDQMKVENMLINHQKHCATSNTYKPNSSKDVTMSPGSPVFRIRKNNKKSKKMRALLVKSPVIMESTRSADLDVNKINCYLNFSEGLDGTGNEDNRGQGYCSEEANSIQDDSFQNMSFSCIDELCKSSVATSECNTTDNTNISAAVNSDIEGVYSASNVLAKGISQQGKFFYENAEKSVVLHPVLSVDCFLKNAKRLEEGANIPDSKIKEVFPDKELTVFSKMVKEVPEGDMSGQGWKRNRAEGTTKKNKIIKLDKGREVVSVKETVESFCDVSEDINSHFDANDSEMCLTAAYAESLINNSNNTSRTGSNVDNLDDVIKHMKFPMFSTASGNSISISNEAYRRVQNIFKDDFEEKDVFKPDKDNTRGEEEEKEEGFQGFKTASGARVQISEKSLQKVKNLFNEETDNIGFSTASGSKIKISEQSLNKARKMLSCEDDKVDAENGEECRRNKVYPQSAMLGFKTASNKEVNISKESLRKVEELWRGEECLADAGEKRKIRENVRESDQQTGGDVKFYGFSTASGRNVGISSDALSKAQKLLGDATEEGMEECRKETKSVATEKQAVVDNGDSEELIPAWIHVYNTSPTMTMERLQLEAVTAHEDCRHSTPREQYLVRSPALGATDRFYRRKKNPGRKLIFEPESKLETPTENELRPSFNSKTGVRKWDMSDADIDFAVPFKRRKLNDGDFPTQELSDEVKEGRRKARLEQTKAGRKGKVKPVKGSHLLKKSATQMSWSGAVQGTLPERYPKEALLKHGVKENVIAVTAATAVDYKFKSTDFFTCEESFSNRNGFPAGDGCTLIFNDENMAGVKEFTSAFFASPGVEPNLISTAWVRNHYRWIVWKLSHYERAFPVFFAGRCLTPHNVLVQLKYRYDREIDCSQRSALRRILERDDSCAKRIVLCVCDIKKTTESDRKQANSSLDENLMTYTLGVSDGWYSCYAQTDSAMTRMIETGKVFVGTKLVTQGAELLNCDKGISPLEAAESLHMKIATNSTRRVKWDVKLGFQKNGGPILIHLNSILLNGGIVGRIDVIVARIYPQLYMEKKSDGSHVTRNSRMEDRAIAAYQQQQEAAVERIYQQVKDELRTEEKAKEKLGAKPSTSQVKEVSDPDELYKLYEQCPDPSLFENLLTSKQKEMLIDYQRRKTEMSNKELSERVQERIKIEQMNSRKVSQLLRIRLVDLHKPDYANPVLFTVWNSTEDVSRMFSEGKSISIYNAAPGNTRFLNSVQLNSTRKTRYKELSQAVEYPGRKLTRLSELTIDCEPVFGEVDLVGLIVAIHEVSHGSRLSQTIFLADEDCNFVGIVFWGCCKEYGWENVLTVSSVVSCSNLQWSKKRSVTCIPSVYVNDTSVFTENPKHSFLKEEIKRLKVALPEDRKSFISKCAEDITAKLGDTVHNLNLSRNSPIQSCSSLGSSLNLKPKYINGFKTKPNASSTPFKSASFVSDATEPEPSPIQKRIEKLQMYGEPPPLSPLLPLDNLEKFKSKFRVPFKNIPSIDSASK